MALRARIIGWRGDAGSRFHDYMSQHAKEYGDWDQKAVELEVFECCEELMTEDCDLYYELSAFHSKTNNPVLVGFKADDFMVVTRCPGCLGDY